MQNFIKNAKKCKKYVQYATNMHNMQQICNKYAINIQYVCKIHAKQKICKKI